jgi:hypothetical protein
VEANATQAVLAERVEAWLLAGLVQNFVERLDQ